MASVAFVAGDSREERETYRWVQQTRINPHGYGKAWDKSMEFWI